MAAKPREMTDSMHYESRQIRDALAASNARLRSARTGRLPPDLQPQVGAALLQEWEGLSTVGNLDEGTNLAADHPLYQQMRGALLAFENEVGYAAPARERAFFSALRTQLMEAGVQRDTVQRDMQIAAIHKWFMKHQPQGPEADPVTAAVLASSLAVEAAAPALQEVRPSLTGSPSAAHQMRISSAQQQQQQQQLPPGFTGGPVGPVAAATAAGSPAAQGNKHFFFDVYSRAQVTTNGAAASTASGLGGGGGAALRPTSAARGPSPSGRPLGRSGDEGPPLTVNHPLAMYPTVGTGGGVVRGAAAAGPSSGGGAAAAAAAAAGIPAGPPRARFASTDLYAPGKLVRSQELDDLDYLPTHGAAATVAGGGGGGASSASLHAKPWISGPFKAPVGTGGSMAYGSTAGAAAALGRAAAAAGARHNAPAGPEEDEEIRMLRGKWAAMEARTNQSVSDVQTKVAEWSLQRARLEEEMVRRQEASRIAPLNGNVGGNSGAALNPHAVPWQIDGIRRTDYDDGLLVPGTLSPYAHANADLAAATAAAASGPGALGFVMPSGGLHGAAAAAMGASMRMRHADVVSYDRGRAELMDRLAGLGLNVTGDTLDRALRPLEDRPFLDCIARLPRPGENLASRPDSVRLPAAKKKRAKSAAKKRPTSGR